jgi:hypothetical protein
MTTKLRLAKRWKKAKGWKDMYDKAKVEASRRFGEGTSRYEDFMTGWISAFYKENDIHDVRAGNILCSCPLFGRGRRAGDRGK